LRSHPAIGAGQDTYYEATARVLEIMRGEGTSAATLLRIAAEEEKAAAAIKRIKQIRGLQR
jgi:hypothetical protein